jgi:hypothetical protein
MENVLNLRNVLQYEILLRIFHYLKLIIIVQQKLENCLTVFAFYLANYESFQNLALVLMAHVL